MAGGIISGVMGSVFLVIILIPNFVDIRGDPEWRAGIACVSNLRTLEGAKGTWALENNKMSNAVPKDTDLFGDTKYIREKPVCPSRGTYTLGSVAEKPRCSIPSHTI